MLSSSWCLGVCVLFMLGFARQIRSQGRTRLRPGWIPAEHNTTCTESRGQGRTTTLWRTVQAVTCRCCTCSHTSIYRGCN